MNIFLRFMSDHKLSIDETKGIYFVRKALLFKGVCGEYAQFRGESASGL